MKQLSVKWFGEAKIVQSLMYEAEEKVDKEHRNKLPEQSPNQSLSQLPIPSAIKPVPSLLRTTGKKSDPLFLWPSWEMKMGIWRERGWQSVAIGPQVEFWNLWMNDWPELDNERNEISLKNLLSKNTSSFTTSTRIDSSPYDAITIKEKLFFSLNRKSISNRFFLSFRKQTQVFPMRTNN